MPRFTFVCPKCGNLEHVYASRLEDAVAECVFCHVRMSRIIPIKDRI